jgi:hypothetical protein
VILIPEIETVVILTPKVASGSLRRAIVAQYPQAVLLYRHMEADGVPHGYDRWQKIGVVREPVARLWSLYKFLADFDGPHEPAYLAAMRTSVRMPFSEWVVENQTVFTSPYDSAGSDRFFPRYTVMHSLPETRKSQFVYLRPDLGTKVYRYDDLAALERRLDITLSATTNRTKPVPIPMLTPAAQTHIERFFRWDIAATESLTEQAV